MTSTRRVKLEDGSSVRLRDADPSLTLYADAHLVNQLFLRRGDGWCHSWNDRPVRWFPDLERQVIMLQGYPGDSDDVLDGLVRWRDALYGWGARIGSPAAASSSLLRATITGPLFLGDPFNPDRPRISSVLGGRQESYADPGVYGSFAQVDLRAAYARTLGRLVYPPGGRWVRFKGPDLPSGETLPQLVRARVRVPPGVVPPLPRRPRYRPPGPERASQTIEYPTGRIRGLWSRGEVEMAARAGCEVKVIETYVLLGAHYRPFSEWWRRVKAGRSMDGYAGDLFKQVGNTLWGRFALDGIKTVDRFSDGRRISSTLRGGFNPALGAPDLSEQVSAAVRVRLYDELIRPQAGRLIAVHTDGGLVRTPAVVPPSSGWRIKRRGRMLIFINPQVYAFSERGRGLEYVFSGISPDSVPAAFAGLCRLSLGWPPTTFGRSVAARDEARLRALCAALGAVEVEAAG